MHLNLEQQADLKDRLETFEQACKKAGLKITHQRLEIFRELAIALDHPSVETIHARLKTKLPTISMDTVYRTLTTLEKQGLISKVQTVESQARFEVTSRQHHHLVCDKCHEIVDFQWRVFDESPLPLEATKWGQITAKKAIIHGLCHKCLQKTGAEK